MNSHSMKIAIRLGVGFGLMIIFAVVLAGVALYSVRISAVNLEGEVKQQRLDVLIREWEASTRLNFNRTMAIAESGNNLAVEAYFAPRIAQTTQDISRIQQAVTEGFPKGYGQLEEIAGRRSAYLKARDEYFNALKANDAGAGVLGETLSRVADNYINGMADLSKMGRDLNETTVTHTLSTLHTSTEVLAVTSVLALLVGLSGAILIAHSVNQTNAALLEANRNLKESQVQLIQSEKMSALGQMVAGIVHEINTPLAYVKGTLSVLQEQLAPIRDLAVRSHQFVGQLRATPQDKPALQRMLREIESGAKDAVEHGTLDDMSALLGDGLHGIEQISEIVVNLKNFSRLDRAKVANFSVEAGLDSTLVLAGNMLKNKVTVNKEYTGVTPINGSPSQINQVFLNIITNAVQAMPERVEPNVITLRTAMEDEKTVRIEIEDNGSGIPKDALSKIFDPFFTTKPVGQGTGMGLSISYQIIQAHGGQLLVDSEVGVGTVFTILLPVKTAQGPAGSVVEDEAPADKPHEAASA